MACVNQEIEMGKQLKDYELWHNNRYYGLYRGTSKKNVIKRMLKTTQRTVTKGWKAFRSQRVTLN
jgi:cell division protein YceG involved in septum cleavage